MNRTFTVVIQRDADGWYVAHVPDLAGCRTQARTREELEERIREAILLCLEDDDPDEEPLEFVGVETITP